MGGRAVEGTGLENRQGCKLFVGSNPTPSAIFLLCFFCILLLENSPSNFNAKFQKCIIACWIFNKCVENQRERRVPYKRKTHDND